MHLIDIPVILIFVTVATGASIEKTNDVGIINGHEITIEDAPYMVSLRKPSYHDPKNYTHFCAGSIIHESFILTAAHCLLSDQHYKIMAGTNKRSEEGDVYEVKKKIKNSKYSMEQYDFDVGLIMLSKKLVFGKKVQKIVLTTAMEVKEGAVLETAGWGFTHEHGPGSNDLKQTKIPMITTKLCKKIHSHVKAFNITSRMICAGGPGSTSCYGDSGGPLLWNNTQVGITSFGERCGVFPGVYTKVSAMLPWIFKQIDANLRSLS